MNGDTHTMRKRLKRRRSDIYTFVRDLERVLSSQDSSSQESNTDDGHSSHLQGSHFDMNTGVYANSTAEQNFRITFPTNSSAASDMNVTLDEQKRVALSEPELLMGPPPLELIAEGLDSVDNETLRQSLDPIWKSLESIDAIAMLDLKIVDQGARVSDGYATIRTSTLARPFLSHVSHTSSSSCQCLLSTDS